MTPSRQLRKEWLRARRNVDKATDRVWSLAREQHLRLLLLAAIVGVVAGLGAVGVKELIAGVQTWGCCP